MIRSDREIGVSVDELTADSGIVSGLGLAATLAWSAARSQDPPSTLRPLVPLIEQDADQLVTIAAVHALSATSGPAPSVVLTELLGDPRAHVNEHAAWALSARASHRPSMSGLVALVADGGFRGMLAQRTLRGWASGDPPAVAAAILAGLGRAGAQARAKLVETLGLVRGRSVGQALTLIAGERDEHPIVRRAAISALGDRPIDRVGLDLLHQIASGDHELAAHAMLALLTGADLPSPEPQRAGLRIAQVYLYADLEAGLDRAGAGDQGGIATLLALLSESLAVRADVAEVRSISRGSVEDAVAAAWTTGAALERHEPVPFGDGAAVDARSAWAYRIEIERGIGRALRAGVRPHVLHLRLADVGTLAADAAARRLGIPVVFTAAPDPHAVLESLAGAGALARADFGDSDEREHWWFRARMVEQLTARSDRVALLPRGDGIAGEMRRMLGVDVSEPTGRCVVIPEGVHAGTVRRAAADVRHLADTIEVTRHRALPAGVDALVEAVAALPAARHRLPLVVTVGRLHPLKGVDRIVRAWATSDVAARANLIVVGGDLANPTADELDVLATIDDIVGEAPNRRDGLILLGHRPHGDVARILASAALGVAPDIAAGGVYACGSLKEEFGLAIVEAIAAGLPVVAPSRGGPATYVDDARNGRLVDTTSVSAIAGGIADALEMARDREAMAAASANVLEHLTIEVMAERLVSLYSAAVLTVTASAARSCNSSSSPPTISRTTCRCRPLRRPPGAAGST